MGKLFFDISMSLDGLIAGPNASLEKPLGEGGDRLYEWAFALECTKTVESPTGVRHLSYDVANRAGAG